MIFSSRFYCFYFSAFPLFLAIFSQHVLGFPIYYEAQAGSSISGRIFSGVASACNALDEMVDYPSGDNVIITPPSLPTRANYLCTVAAKSGIGSVSVWLFEKGYDCSGATSYNPFVHKCIYASQNGVPPEYSCPVSVVGNPINIISGEKIQREEDVSAANGKLKFYRVYNSADGIWRHNFAISLEFYSDHIALIHGDGRSSYFLPSESFYPLSRTELGRLSKTLDGWLFESPEGQVINFDANGRLTSLSERPGELITLTRTEGMVSARNNLGDYLEFSEGAAGQPLQVNYHGKIIKYSYGQSQRLLSVISEREGQSSSIHYLYENTSIVRALTGVIDANGINYARWTYDNYGRAVSSEHAGGAEKTTLVYNSDGSVVVTNEYGKKATYRFQVIQGVKRITAIEGGPTPNCPYSNSTFTYDERGLLKTRTDAKGNLTIYEYNDRGLEVNRTEAAGTPQARTITTEWHPSLFLKTQVTEPGRVIRYQYDAQGRRTGQTTTAL